MFQIHTLCRLPKGRRPSFSSAGKPEFAKDMYMKFIDGVRKYPIKVETGEYQATMYIDICNDGPVTMILNGKIR